LSGIYTLALILHRVLLLAFTLFAGHYLSAQWVWQPQFHTENRLRDVHLTPDGRGIAIGEGNVLLCTTNGGETWTGTGSADPDLNAASLVGSTFFFGNLQGGIFSLSNPGLCLSDLLAIATPALSNLSDLHMLSASSGYAVANGFLRYSNNAWSSSTAVTNLNCPTDAQSIWFVTEDVGFAVTNSGKIIRIRQDAGTFLCDQVAASASPLHNIHFVGAQYGYAVGASGTVLYSDDSGLSWQNRSLPEEDDLTAVFATAAQTVHAAGNQLYRSADGGVSWERLPKPSPMTRAEALWFLDANNGWVVGANGFIGFTGNAGGSGLPLFVPQALHEPDTWSLQPNPASGSAQIAASSPVPQSWSLWNSLGTCLQRGSLHGTTSLELDGLAPGLYWVRVGEQGPAKALLVQNSDGQGR